MKYFFSCLAKLDDVLKRKDVILATLSDDLAENGKFGLAGIQITEASTTFLGGLLTTYVAKLKENISARFPSLPLVQAFSIFDLERLPAKEATDFKTYGVNHVATLADHFGVTEYVDVEALKSEWEHFKFVAQDLKTECSMTTTPQPGNTPTEWLLTKLCGISSFRAMFLNLMKLATVAQTLPVTNAWPERGASALKRIKTRLRNSLKDDMLESLLQIAINGPSVSQAKDVVEQAVGLWLQEKQRRKLPKITASTSATTRENCEVVQGTELIDFLTEEVEVLNDKIQDLEDELFTQEQVFKKLLVNMCTPTDDSSDCEDDYEDDYQSSSPLHVSSDTQSQETINFTLNC